MHFLFSACIFFFQHAFSLSFWSWVSLRWFFTWTKSRRKTEQKKLKFLQKLLSLFCSLFLILVTGLIYSLIIWIITKLNSIFGNILSHSNFCAPFKFWQMAHIVSLTIYLKILNNLCVSLFYNECLCMSDEWRLNK